MENFGVNLSKVKQPKPDLQAEDGQKRVIKNPYVGIISDINPTATPISDTLIIREREIPRSNYKPNVTKNTPFSFDNFATSGIIVCGVLALLSIFKKK